MITGFRCAVCGAGRDIAEVLPWRCPNATEYDRRHVLHLVGSSEAHLPSENPFARYRPRLAWWAFAHAHGMSDAVATTLTREVASEFFATPLERSEFLSERTGREVWVKDETRNVAGSHKARHLVGIMLHLRAAEELGLLGERPPLAIASCGNAALAAATLAAGADWPIDVYVPTWMDDEFGHRLDELDARIHRCERRHDDPPGDPAMFRFREAVAAGSIPFSVQGPENGYCLDGGRTIGWEIADQCSAQGIEPAALYAQVGGGAFATCAAQGSGLALRAVQSEGCAPLAAALERAETFDEPVRHWAEVMRPWPAPHSLADGIIDDETYDWIAIANVLAENSGRTVVVPESTIEEAYRLAQQAGYPASPTGAAGLAGLLADAEPPDGPVVLVMTGVDRTANRQTA